jgi:hypothetical protein
VKEKISELNGSSATGLGKHFQSFCMLSGFLPLPDGASSRVVCSAGSCHIRMALPHAAEEEDGVQMWSGAEMC